MTTTTTTKTPSMTKAAIAQRARREAAKLTQDQESVVEAILTRVATPAKIYDMPEAVANPEVVVAEVSAPAKRRGPAPRFEKPTLDQWFEARIAAAEAALLVARIGQGFHQESAVAQGKVLKAEAALAEAKLRKILP